MTNLASQTINLSVYTRAPDGNYYGLNPSGVIGDPPGAPGLSVAYLSDISLRLTLTDNSSDETGFEIQVSPNGTDSWSQLTTLAANVTTYDHTGLTVDTTYYYRTRAVNAAGNSDWVTANGTTTQVSEPTSTPNLFYDGFESGDITAPNGPSPALNANNFAWGALNRTSIVTGGPGANQTVHPNVINVNDSRDWTAKEGSNSLRFRYPAGDEWAEQRYSHDPVNDFWVRYWIRVPTNFNHSPVINHKFFVAWMDDYLSNGPAGKTLIYELWPTSGSSGGADILYQYTGDGTGALTPNNGRVPFLTTSDAGRWMQLVHHIRSASSPSANDGVIELHRRFEDEPSFTQIFNQTDADIAVGSSTQGGWSGGYLMGWANQGYAADTEWLIDQYEMSTESLL